MKTVYGNATMLDYCCGVDVIGRFSLVGQYAEESVAKLRRSGTGLSVSAFTDTVACKAAYLRLCKKRKLIYQSPLYYNKLSGNLLFLCVFEVK